MTVFPVAARELRVAARQAGSYWGRSLAATVALGLFAWVFLLERHVASNQLGQSLFVVITTFAYIFAALAGVLFSADCISRERRDGTLGLLFLTDLRGYDVALGKLAASSLAAVYGLLAILPVLGLSVLLGGVSGTEYARVVVVLGCVLLTSLALGMLASTYAADGVRAAGLALGMLLLWQFGIFLAAGLARFLGDAVGTSTAAIDSMFEPLFVVSPITGIMAAFSHGFRKAPDDFAHASTVCALLGVAFLTVASRRLPKIWQVAAGRPGAGWGGRLKRLRFVGEAQWRQHRQSLLELHPVAWLVGRHWGRRWLVWLGLGGGAAAYFTVALIEGSREWWEVSPILFVTVLAQTVLKLWVAMEAPRLFFADRRSGALELILTTPVDGAELVRGHRLALRRLFLGPAMMLTVFEVLAGLRQFTLHPENHDNPLFAATLAAHMFVFWDDLRTLGWTGQWAGLSATGSRTSVYVVLKVLVLPWVVFLVLATSMVLLAPRQSDAGSAMLLVWLAINSVNAALWRGTSRRSLLSRLRETVAMPQGRGRRAAP